MEEDLFLHFLVFILFITSTSSMPSRFVGGLKPRQLGPSVSGASNPPAPSSSASVLASQYAFYNQTGYFPPHPPVYRQGQRFKRDTPPPVPMRPSTSDSNSFHGSQFQYLEQTGYAPAVDSMPVFLFSRPQPIYQPCYPESAVVIGSNPPIMNPGTNVPNTPNPGTDCNDPGPYHGAYSLGNAFPIYVVATHCDNKDEWRINYAAYFVHDGIGIGAIKTGHRHDWQDVTVVWQRDPEGDWWHRAGAIYAEHSWHNWFPWSDLHTVDVDVPDGPTDVKDDGPGAMKKHPKTFVGFYSHAAFPDKDDKDRQTEWNEKTEFKGAKHLLDQEYRSDDWWRMPRLEDIHSGDEIDPTWVYGSATSTPPYNKAHMCGW